jgi:nucleoside-diphosphate-sugar epimerase
MKIFVTGATGYLGEEVALAVRREGHEVYCLVRDKKKAGHLEVNEINVVQGNLTQPETYQHISDLCQIIIHTAADYSNYFETDSIAVDTFLASSQRSTNKKVLIYTSGILVYPDRPNEVSDEYSETDNNVPYPLNTRPSIEKRVLKAEQVYGCVVRPSFVFGKNSRHFYGYFKQALEGKVIVPGNPHIIWSEVHIDDLVDGYIRLINAPPSVIGGEAFNFADDSRNTNLAIATAFAKEAGFTGDIEVNGPVAFVAGQKTVIVDYRKATRLLGWKPKHFPLLSEVPLYYRTWKAQQALKT